MVIPRVRFRVERYVVSTAIRTLCADNVGNLFALKSFLLSEHLAIPLKFFS
jgi:hypothetical protein